MLEGGNPSMHDLTYTYEAKVIASKKIQRSLEGVPAHTPDSDRLGYYKQRRLENHFYQKEKKWNT